LIYQKKREEDAAITQPLDISINRRRWEKEGTNRELPVVKEVLRSPERDFSRNRRSRTNSPNLESFHDEETIKKIKTKCQESNMKSLLAWDTTNYSTGSPQRNREKGGVTNATNATSNYHSPDRRIRFENNNPIKEREFTPPRLSNYHSNQNPSQNSHRDLYQTQNPNPKTNNNTKETAQEKTTLVTFPSYQKYENNKGVIQGLETKIGDLNQEKKRVENELFKMPAAPKQLEQKRKKIALEQDLDDIEKEIDDYKIELRKIGCS